MKLDLATIPGHCIGPEVVEQALRALRAAAEADGGEEPGHQLALRRGYYLATGHILDDAELAERDLRPSVTDSNDCVRRNLRSKDLRREAFRWRTTCY